MSQTSKYLKIILIGTLSLVVSGLAMACGSSPPPTPTTPASPTPPPAIIAPDDGCVECHTDQEKLIANATEEEVVEELSEGEG